MNNAPSAYPSAVNEFQRNIFRKSADPEVNGKPSEEFETTSFIIIII
jgi:hypothetical protein